MNKELIKIYQNNITRAKELLSEESQFSLHFSDMINASIKEWEDKIKQLSK